MRNVRQYVLTLAVIVSAMGLAIAGDKKPAPAGDARGTQSIADPNYVIGPQDVLNISVWKEPDLSGTIPVRLDGKISLPLLNDIQAAGYTPMKLTEILTEKLKKFIADPQVAVIVSAINSQRIYILGQVGRPGTFPLLPEMTVLQALSSAGGLSQYTSGKNIYILRNENGAAQRFAFNYKKAIKGENPGQNIALKAGDTIVVP